MEIQKRDILSIADLSPQEIQELLQDATTLKKQVREDKAGVPKPLAGKMAALLFEKPSLRTKGAFMNGSSVLGASPVYFGPEEVGLRKREPVSDVAQVLSEMAFDVIVARVFTHQSLQDLAKYAKAPVINALSDLEHPSQILADLMTILEIRGKLKGLNLAFVGDGNNNVTHSLALGCAQMGMNFAVAAPQGYEMDPDITLQANAIAQKNQVKILQTKDPRQAAEGADIVYTDTWVSMGQEQEAQKRISIFKPYQVTQEMMKQAKPDAIFMHDMPAYRGKEVAAEVIDGSQSVIYQEAGNRFYTAAALLKKITLS